MPDPILTIIDNAVDLTIIDGGATTNLQIVATPAVEIIEIVAQGIAGANGINGINGADGRDGSLVGIVDGGNF